MSDRIGRLELLFWCIASAIGAGILVAIVSIVTNTPIRPERAEHPGAQGLVMFGAAVVILKAYVARFHDLGWPGWAILLMFVPPLSYVTFLLLLVIPGQRVANAYGDPPIFLVQIRRLVAVPENHETRGGTVPSLTALESRPTASSDSSTEDPRSG